MQHMPVGSEEPKNEIPPPAGLLACLFSAQLLPRC